MRTLVWIIAATLVLGACGEDSEPRGDPEAGAAVVEGLDLSCGLCHTLQSAGFTGQAAPNLDELDPGYDTVLDALREGPGVMPSYRDELSEGEMHDLAAYISREAGS